MSTPTVCLSVADAAARLGVSTDTVRRKLKRGQLQAKRDNHGQWWVDVPADAKPPEPMRHAAYEPRRDPVGVLVEELRNQLARIGTDLDAAHARETAERERHAEEIKRLEADRDRWARIAEELARKPRSWWPWRRTA
jgi:excisionase family DNA binding protein